jgi:ribosomal protein L15E
MKTPNKLDQVLAEIEHINDLGKSKYYEVVFFDNEWKSYTGSNTLLGICSHTSPIPLA